MSAEPKLSRRAFASGVALLALTRGASAAQGLAGLGGKAAGYAQVTPGKTFSFPADHGPHPDFHIEWWYVTANLVDAAGVRYGAQWTLFRTAMQPGPQRQGWASQQIWMGHAALTSATTHRFAQTFARGGIGQAGVETEPFRAWIDSWRMQGSRQMNPNSISPLALTAQGPNFSYALQLNASQPLVLEGDDGYSRKSQEGPASYYYSQPFFKVSGSITIDTPIKVTGLAWMDREWSSQPLASNETGWDWFGLHFSSGEQLMLYRMRQKDGNGYISGNFISPDSKTRLLTSADVTVTPKDRIEVEGHKLPVEWQVTIPSLKLAISSTPLNARAWMGTGVPYWEGPISFHGSHTGVGYLEMTGY